MWQLENRTPFAAGQGWIRDRDGAETWLVVVKATFEVGQDGALRICAEQPEPVRIPQWNGEPGRSSLRLDSDFVLTKATTDVLLLGHAHAPTGLQVRQLDVSLAVGDLHKTLRVYGDRSWGASGPSAPTAFTAVPLVYERAFGGVDPDSALPERDWDWRNPVGCGFGVQGGRSTKRSVPNIERSDALLMSATDRPPPAGFGPIPGHWQPRAGLAGTYGPEWEATRQPLLPSDCSDRFFNCAPADQQTSAFLSGGEPVRLVNVSPRGPIELDLPRMALGLETHFSDGERRPHGASLHTVVFEPDLSRVSLVWHSAIECHAKVYSLEKTRVAWFVPGGRTPDESPEDLLELV